MSRNGKNGNRSEGLQSLPAAADKKDDNLIRVVIETPKCSRNKYAFNPDEGFFELKKVLPSGMYFPYDFGFVPSTLADDGDPLDVIVLMDEPAFPGCVLKARLVGVIEGEQIEDGKKERNDRLVAIEQDDHSFAHVQHIADLGKQFLNEIAQFFVNYHGLSGTKYKVLGAKGVNRAKRLLAQSQQQLQKSK